MKRALLLVTIFVFSLQNLVFAQEISSFSSEYGMGSSLLDAGVDIEYDSEGNILVYGFFDDDMDFDLSEDDFTVDPLGSPDLFLAKYNADKELLWLMSLGRISLVDGMTNGQLKIDGENNIIISGGFASNVNFDPLGEPTVVSSTGGEDAFIAKYDSDGLLIWVKQIGGISTDRAFCHALSTDNNIVIGLGFSGDVDMDPGEGENILVNQGAVDGAVVALDQDGNFLLAEQIATENNDIISAVEVADDGRIGVGAIVNGATSGFPDRDMRLSFHEATGSEIWSYDYQNFDDANLISHLMFSADGNSLFVGGRINGLTDFDPSPDQEVVIDPVFTDPFIARYGLDGSLEWANYVNSSGTEDYFSGMAEAGSALTVIGSFDVLATFVEGDFTSQRPSAGGQDVFIAAYDKATGEWIEADVYGGSGDEYVRESFFLEAGNLICTGSYSNSLNLEPEGAQIDGFGFTDVFFAEFAYQTDLSDGNPQQSLQDLSVYPNPTSGEVNIAFPSQFGAQNVNVKVFNVVGQEVMKLEVSTANRISSLDLSFLNKGIYIIELSTADQNVSRRLIKQ